MFFLYSIRGVLLVFENVFRSWRSFIKTLVVLVVARYLKYSAVSS